MTPDQITLALILLATVVLFLWGRWRHDIVAATALLACVVAGILPADAAFSGFGHPAVITVACVLILSAGLQQSGAVDSLTRRFVPADGGPLLTMAALTGLAAVLSAFMNNVGALALLMPVAIQAAGRQGIPPGRLLMPMAFGSILGGMTTLIGTPPNLIVSGFRADTGLGTFGMFDFAPVGLAVAGVGVGFLLLLGWRLVPARERADAEGFETSSYVTEARVPEKARAVGMRLDEVEAALEDADAQVLGIVRNEVRVRAPDAARKLRAGDILVIEAEPESLATALSSVGLTLEEDVRDDKDDTPAKDGDDNGGDDDEATLLELTVLPDSSLSGRSATDVRLRDRFGVNLLAISRQGERSVARLRSTPLRAGDVLLMHGAPDALRDFAALHGCVPLAERALRIPDPRKALIASTIMAAAIAGAVLGLVPAAVAFAGGVLATMVFRVVPPRTIYDAVDWPVIVLLAALIPVAGAMATTGTADLLADGLLTHVAREHAVVSLVLILMVTMTLSDFMNNAATAAVMCPIAIGTAQQLGVSPDPFLMAVAVGASCAFLTPIGHQNNTLILGPGGFRFSDYWRLGLPMELLVIAVAVPMLLLVWPL